MPKDPLDPFVKSPGTAGVFLDFDGTLSEIVNEPSQARPVEGVPRLLDELNQRFGCVAVVSGRSAHQLLEWLGPGVESWGLHGAERSQNGRVVVSEKAAPYTELMQEVKEEASNQLARLGIPGAQLEDKGVILALHWRAAEDLDAAEQAIEKLADDLASRHGLNLAGGKLALELRPPGEYSKSAVVLERAADLGLEAAAFVGDDRVDLSAFEALDALAREGLTTLRVAVDSEEAPEELLRRADIVLDGPRSVVEWLQDLVDRGSSAR